MDVERAQAKVSELQALLDESRRLYELSHENYWRSESWESLNRSILKLLPLIRTISAEIAPDLPSRLVEVNQMYSWPWDTCFDACIELEGTLSSLEELAEILGPRGPQLAAASLHPWVWNSALDLWSVGKYRPAVLDSYTKVEAMTQAKLSLIDLSGRKLWGEAFSMSQPRQGRARLRFGELPERSERRSAAQEGAMHFAIGCAQGIRNWAAHTNESATEHVALEYLASLSVLARWVDECVVELAPSP